MDKIIERGLLFDFYGDLLTPHQQKIYSEAVFNDLSLAELSAEEGITRQGVHDLIKRCDKLMEGYEEKLKLVDKFQTIRKEVSNLSVLIDSSKGLEDNIRADLKEGLKTIIEEL